MSFYWEIYWKQKERDCQWPWLKLVINNRKKRSIVCLMAIIYRYVQKKETVKSEVPWPLCCRTQVLKCFCFWMWIQLYEEHSSLTAKEDNNWKRKRNCFSIKSTGTMSSCVISLTRQKVIRCNWNLLAPLE